MELGFRAYGFALLEFRILQGPAYFLGVPHSVYAIVNTKPCFQHLHPVLNLKTPKPLNPKPYSEPMSRSVVDFRGFP